MEYESLHPNAPATPTIRHSLALYNGSEPSTSTSGPQHQCDIMDDIDYHIVEEMVDDPDVVMNTEVENSTQPSTDVHDKDASTIWNRSGYTSGMLAKPRSKLLRTSCRSVGKPAASRNYDVQSKNLSKKKDVLELQEQNFLKLQTMQGLEKELLEARIIREEELHKMDVASRQGKDKREEELYRMDVASKKAKDKRDDDIHLAEVTERHLRKQREKELFELAKKKLMLEVDILKKDLGNNNE